MAAIKIVTLTSGNIAIQVFSRHGDINVLTNTIALTPEMAEKYGKLIAEAGAAARVAHADTIDDRELADLDDEDLDA